MVRIWSGFGRAHSQPGKYNYIIFFSIFFLRRRIFSRHKCIFAAFGQLLRESGQFECWDGDMKRKGMCGYDGNVGVLCM